MQRSLEMSTRGSYIRIVSYVGTSINFADVRSTQLSLAVQWCNYHRQRVQLLWVPHLRDGFIVDDRGPRRRVRFGGPFVRHARIGFLSLIAHQIYSLGFWFRNRAPSITS